MGEAGGELSSEMSDRSSSITKEVQEERERNQWRKEAEVEAVVEVSDVGVRAVVERSMTVAVEGGTLRNGSQSGKPHQAPESLIRKKSQLEQIIQGQETARNKTKTFSGLIVPR